MALLRHFIFSVPFVLVCTTFSSARAEDGMQLLAWDEVIREAQNNNPELRAAEDGLRAAQAEIRGAVANFRPQIGVSSSFNRGQSGRSGELGTADANYRASVSMSYPLFAGFRDQAGLLQAEIRQTISQYNFQILKSRLSYELKAAFTDLATAQRSLDLQEQIIQRRSNNLSLVRLRFEGGFENKGSVLLSEAYLKEARFNRDQALASKEVAQHQLARILGRSPGASMRVTGQVPSEEPPKGLVFDQLVYDIPDFRRAKEDEALAKATLTVARAPYFPTISVSGDYSRFDEQWFPANEGWSVGLSINYPLYSGGRDRANMDRAAAELDATLATQENLTRDLLTRLRQGYHRFVAAEEELTIGSTFLEAAEIRAEIARSQYNNGLITFEEWDRIETDLIMREQRNLTLQRDRVVAEAAFEQLRGIGVL